MRTLIKKLEPKLPKGFKTVEVGNTPIVRIVEMGGKGWLSLTYKGEPKDWPNDYKWTVAYVEPIELNKQMSFHETNDDAIEAVLEHLKQHAV